MSDKQKAARLVVRRSGSQAVDRGFLKAAVAQW
jgi:hypothetical protein